MKTHIDLPKPVYQTASRMAADQGISLSELFMKLLAKTNGPKIDNLRSSQIMPEKTTESFDWRDELL